MTGTYLEGPPGTQLVAIADVAALIALFGVNAARILFGWLQENYEEPRSGGWLPFVFGCIAGIVPCIRRHARRLTPELRFMVVLPCAA